MFKTGTTNSGTSGKASSPIFILLVKLNEVKNKYAVKITDISLAMASESPQRSEEISVTDNISQSTSAVNTKFYRQLLNDTWDDIRIQA